MTALIRPLFLALLLISTLAFAQGTYTQIDVPGANGTIAYGINSTGEIVGTYGNSSGDQPGFLLSGGAYTTITYPSAQYTTLWGINDNGLIVGSGDYTGFLYDLNSQTFSEPTCSAVGGANVVPNAINNRGTMAGTVLPTRGGYVGFRLSGSTCELIEPPSSFRANVIAGGISASGAVAIYVESYTKSADFLYRNSNYFRLNIPNDAEVWGINPSATAVVGYYDAPSSVTEGFLFQNNTFTVIQFPGSNYTVATGINASGQVVGYFEDSTSGAHGFLWTPPAAEKK